MSQVVTSGNPAGVRPFDLTPLAYLPEYQAAAQAVDALLQALNDAGIELDQADWLTAIRELTAAVPFADCCDRCRTMTYPHAARIEPDTGEGGWLTGHYRCTCAQSWTCGYSTEAPAHM